MAALIPEERTHAEPCSLRLFRYDARHDIVKCPRGKTLYYRSTRDCAGCALRLDCLPKAWSAPHAVSGARGDGARRSVRMYRRHMWRSEGYHGEAKRDLRARCVAVWTI